MAAAHRNGDLRACGAVTTVSNQSTVFVNSQLWAVSGDPNSHGGGGLIPGGAPTVSINGFICIVLGDLAAPDPLCFVIGGAHCSPNAISASGNVYAGG